MAKTNYKRLKEKKWKLRCLLKSNKIEIPDSIYNKKRDRKIWRKRLKEHILNL